MSLPKKGNGYCWVAGQFNFHVSAPQNFNIGDAQSKEVRSLFMVKQSHLGTKPRPLEITVQHHIHLSKFDKKNAGQAIRISKLVGLGALHLLYTCLCLLSGGVFSLFGFVS
jgi:hypothetical protein